MHKIKTLELICTFPSGHGSKPDEITFKSSELIIYLNELIKTNSIIIKKIISNEHLVHNKFQEKITLEIECPTSKIDFIFDELKKHCSSITITNNQVN